jgi:hypothetical protein
VAKKELEMTRNNVTLKSNGDKIVGHLYVPDDVHHTSRRTTF